MRNKYNAKFYSESVENKTNRNYNQNQTSNQTTTQLNRTSDYENKIPNTNNVEFGCEFETKKRKEERENKENK